MSRKFVWGAGSIVSGLTGWVFGTYAAKRKHLNSEMREVLNLKEDPKVAQYTSDLRKQGYILEIPKISFFMEMHRQYMFTQAVLTRHERLHPEGPITLRNPANGDLAFIFHVGKKLASKDHFPAACTTIFDEGLAMAAFPRLPNKVGVTGTLELSPIYHLPPSDGLVVLHARPTTSKGRKSESHGQLIALSSNQLLSTGKAVMIEPWWGKYIAPFR